MLDWSKITTVLLDMDGTILDLHFDNHFWHEHLPKHYSKALSVSLVEAKQRLDEYYQAVAGTLNWYCLDYWAEITQLPITELKKDLTHLIELRDDAKVFLQALREAGKEVVLVTNAHPDSLSLKIEHTQLDQYFDRLYSTHEFGESKESQGLWQQLQTDHGFPPETTLFIDDSLPILAAAQKFGIKHLVAVANPDSKQPKKSITEFDSITDFRDLLKDLI